MAAEFLRRCTASKTKRNMQTHTTDLMIIGGGASGLAAAVAAKQLYPEISVTILERNARVGKKILATGNGRCNLGNTNQDLEHYHGSFAEQCKKIFSDTQSAEIFFQNMGLLSRHETDGRLYPLSNQATSVLHLRLFWRSVDSLHRKQALTGRLSPGWNNSDTRLCQPNRLLFHFIQNQNLFIR